MRKINQCVIVSAEQDEIDHLRDARYEREIQKYVGQRIVFIDVSTQELPFHDFELVIVEDEMSIALVILERVSQCDSINNVLIVTSSRAMQIVVGTGIPAPAVITLDFLLDADRDEVQERAKAFIATADVYGRIKETWPISYVFGLSAWVVDEKGNPYPTTTDLVNLIRSNGDNVYPKGDELSPFIIHLVRDALSIHRIRSDKQRAEELGEQERKRADVNERLARLKGGPSYEELQNEGSPDESIIGDSLEMRHLYYNMRIFAPETVPITIRGERGTGKELVAKALHKLSGRPPERFIPVDCGAISDSLLEATLFGHEAGSYTDAKTAKPGLFELADKGTLFFDEIANASPALQNMLLRVLQESAIRKVRGSKLINVEVRIMAATNKNLEALRTNGEFSGDLYDRLRANRFPEVPSLRQRREDIPLLVSHFLAKHSKKRNRVISSLTKEALNRLFSHEWEGNIRELETLIEDAVIRAQHDGTITNTIGVNLIGSLLPPIDYSKVLTLDNTKYGLMELAPILKAVKWLNALEVAVTAVLANDLTPTQEEVAKVLISPETNRHIDRARISQVCTTLKDPFVRLVKDHPYLWINLRGVSWFPQI